MTRTVSLDCIDAARPGLFDRLALPLTVTIVAIVAAVIVSVIAWVVAS